MPPVKDLKDIPYLFVTEREEGKERKMGFTRKSTPERLDKIICTIWDYQQKHNGETPTMTFIGNQIGVHAQGMGYWINMLVDEGRINRIGERPFRATITDHKDNTKAISRFISLRGRKEALEAEERDRIRERQEEERRSEQLRTDHAKVLDAAKAELVPVQEAYSEVSAPERSLPTPVERPAMFADATAFGSYDAARKQLRDEGRRLKPLMPSVIKLAETRDLMLELIERGYQVSKR